MGFDEITVKMKVKEGDVSHVAIVNIYMPSVEECRCRAIEVRKPVTVIENGDTSSMMRDKAETVVRNKENRTCATNTLWISYRCTLVVINTRVTSYHVQDYELDRWFPLPRRNCTTLARPPPARTSPTAASPTLMTLASSPSS